MNKEFGKIILIISIFVIALGVRGYFIAYEGQRIDVCIAVGFDTYSLIENSCRMNEDGVSTFVKYDLVLERLTYDENKY